MKMKLGSFLFVTLGLFALISTGAEAEYNLALDDVERSNAHMHTVPGVGSIPQYSSWVNIKAEDLPACPLDNLQFMDMLGRPCMWECYDFLEAKVFILERITQGLHCSGTLSDNEILALVNEVMTADDSVCTAENVFGVNNQGFEQMYMCISSKSVMTIVNKLITACPSNHADFSLLETPQIKTGVLHCAAENTEGADPLQVYYSDIDISDGPEENECISCTTEEAYTWLLRKLIIANKRVEFVESRASTLDSRIEHLRTARGNAPTFEIALTFFKMWVLYFRRSMDNLFAIDEFKFKARDIEFDIYMLETQNPQLQSRRQVVLEQIEREQKQQKEQASRKALDTTERQSLKCVSNDSQCGTHYWKSNIRVNDECFSVCVNTMCAQDFTFFYCFRSTVAIGVTRPNCHANIVTRQTCFQDVVDFD